MPPDLFHEFNRKFDKLAWIEGTYIEQSNLVGEFKKIRNELAVHDAGSIEQAFQRKLQISRDQWFQLIVCKETERLKLIREAWEKRKREKKEIYVPPEGVAAATNIWPSTGWIGDFMSDFGKTTESPDSYLFWAGVCTISAILRRKVFIRFGNWPVFPNFYCIFVSKAGLARKGPPIRAAEMFARTVPDVNLLDRTSTERFVHDLSYRTTTINGQQQRVPCDANGFVCAEELVTFLDDQSYNSGVLRFLIDWWDCQDRKAVRTLKHGIVELKNLYITMLGGTTPDWLQGSLSNIIAGGGMLSRTIFVCEDRTSKFIPMPIAMEEVSRQNLIQQLTHIDSIQGEFGFTDDALTFNDSWYRNFRKYLMDNENEAPALERKQMHLLKLAMILAVSEGKPLVITEELLKRADTILLETEKGMVELSRELLATPLGKDHMRVLTQITKKGGEISRTDLMRLNSPYGMDKEGCDRIINALEESGQILIDVIKNQGKRDRTVYKITPKGSTSIAESSGTQRADKAASG